MLKALFLKDNLNKLTYFNLVLTTALGMFFLYLFSDHLLESLNIILGIVLLPYILSIKDTRKNRYTYLWISLGLLLTYFFIPIRTLLFLGILSGIFYSLDTLNLRVHSIFPLLIITCISPLFLHIGSTIGIPIRLELSRLIGLIFSMADYKTRVVGNLIILNGNEYSVDPACMGLNMFLSSLLISIFLFAYFEKKTEKRISISLIGASIIPIFVLNLLGNIVRIILLILFDIGPESVYHDILGLACIAVYTLWPTYYYIKILYRYKAKSQEHLSEQALPITRMTAGNILLVMMIIYSSVFILGKKNSVASAHFSIPGYSSKLLETGVIQLDKPGALVYVKPIRSFYGAEHSPLICWTSSGYELSNIEKFNCQKTEIYLGQLHKDNKIMNCAWWYDNGKNKTINQFEWRWKVFTGEDPYMLVNINAQDKKTLLNEVQSVLRIK